MADIIDLDFYRKFRVVLPIRPNSLADDLGDGLAEMPMEKPRHHRARRARKMPPRILIRSRRHNSEE